MQNHGALIEGGDHYPVNEWFHLLFIFDVSTGLYDVHFNDDLVYDNLDLQLPDHPSENTLIFVCYSNATIDNVYIDDIVISGTFEDEEGARSPNPPSDIFGAERITNTRKVGPIR